MRRAWTQAALLLLALCGCSPDRGEGPVVATSWSGPLRADLEAEFRRWAGSEEVPPPAPIRWLCVDEADDPTIPAWRGGVDVVVGGTPEAHDRLARAGLAAADGRLDAGRWVSVDRAGDFDARQVRPDVDPEGPAAIGDPRLDPAALAWMAHRLHHGQFFGPRGRGPDEAAPPWAAGYAGLVERARRLVAGGGGPGSAAAALRRGRAVAALAIDPGPGAFPISALPPAVLREGVTMVRPSPEARELLRFLIQTRRARPPGSDDWLQPPAPPLLADLLGATLFDARDELRAAWDALDRPGASAAARRWVGEAPPWPPASIGLLPDGGAASSLAATLADQIAPDPEARAWLKASWTHPARPIDGSLLVDLSRAAGGRLAAEPRFRAWLRGEWTAWARQRYRRVARLASGWTPPS